MLYTTFMVATVAAATPCDQAPAAAAACVEFSGGIAYTEVWTDALFSDSARAWEDLTVVCGTACQVTVTRGDGEYIVFDGQSRVALASATRQLAVVSVFGSRASDLVDISGLGGQTFAHMGAGDDTLYANACTAITESSGRDAVSCGREQQTLSAR